MVGKIVFMELNKNSSALVIDLQAGMKPLFFQAGRETRKAQESTLSQRLNAKTARRCGLFDCAFSVRPEPRQFLGLAAPTP